MPTPVDILILGAGWTSTFLISLCRSRHFSYAATTRSGDNGTFKFIFDQNNDDEPSQLDQFRHLPDATTVLITFPITQQGASGRLVRLYYETRVDSGRASFIQLGATSIWDTPSENLPPVQASRFQWQDRNSPYVFNDRAKAEDELLALSPAIQTTVLNLAGLWGGKRDTRNWVGRVAPTKDALRNKILRACTQSAKYTCWLTDAYRVAST
ncbi:hypothetical protein HGRIS_004466 [Hohenbuehelia grisea]|uniref:Uncharacterized protein n=1 Tax=Hohenbuehelia grisea TaxID=104357 RepID=A0ABR3JCD0_9AGAR